jgi:hypothetical protein
VTGPALASGAAAAAAGATRHRCGSTVKHFPEEPEVSTIDSGTRGHRTGSETRSRPWLRATLPIRRVVGPADVAALAVHIMSNTALTGATYDGDVGQHLVG